MVPELRFADSVILEAISHCVRGQIWSMATLLLEYIYISILRDTLHAITR